LATLNSAEQFATKPARKHADWWWDAAWNPVGGCSYVSPGCKNCFVPSWLASHTHDSETVHTGVTDRVNGRAVFNGNLNVLPDGHHLWNWPLEWPGAAHPKLGPGRPSLVWIADLSDLFEDRPKEIIDRALSKVVISDHIGLVLSKRTQRMAAYFKSLSPRTVRLWQAKLWLGFSAERQREFDERWADMRPLAEAGWFIFVSIAPMIGPVKLPRDFVALGKRTWCIASGEQRVPRTRPRNMKPEWARAVRDQCADACIPFFMKQMAKGAPIPPNLHIHQFPVL
jgi:protein gp37